MRSLLNVTKVIRNCQIDFTSNGEELFSYLRSKDLDMAEVCGGEEIPYVAAEVNEGRKEFRALDPVQERYFDDWIEEFCSDNDIAYDYHTIYYLDNGVLEIVTSFFNRI